jgi:hypothetical protein
MRQQTGSRNRGWLSAIGNRLSVAAGVALVAGMMAAFAGSAQAAVTVTSTGSGNWDAAIWSGGTPAGNDVVIAAGHTVTITGLQARAVNSLTITGTLTHAANGNYPSPGEVHKINMDIATFLMIDSAGKIDVAGAGYSAHQGPGAGISAQRGGGGYGGQGDSFSATTGGTTYGSITNPVDNGSGGGGGGGGAVVLRVAGILTNNGAIVANGSNTTAQLGGGAGGSINVIAGAIAGSGTNTANGGNMIGAGNGAGGGGGRIALVVTNAGATIPSSIRANIQCYGGYLDNNPANATAPGGTIYLREAAQTYGDLMVNWANKPSPKQAVRTLVKDYSYRFDSITTMNKALLVLGTNATFDLTGCTLRSDSTTNSITSRLLLGTAGSTVIWPSAWTNNGCISWTGANGMTTNMDLTVASGGILTHEATSPNNKINLNLTGNLTIDSGGAIWVSERGAHSDGYPAGIRCGAGHGGEGGGTTARVVGNTHGSITNPVSGGSQGQASSAWAYGGGAVILRVTGIVSNNGAIVANGGPTANSKGAGSGGSVSLTAASLGGTGSIQAKGGNYVAGADVSNDGAGGGGRIAVVLTNSATFGSVTMSVDGGTTTGADALKAGAGTIYLCGTNSALGKLIVPQSPGTTRRTLISTLTTEAVAGDVELQSGALLAVSNTCTLTVYGNWSNASANAVGGSGTVEFKGATTSTLYGSTVFNPGVVCNAAGKTLLFQGGQTNAMLKALTIAGANLNPVSLMPATAGQQWYIKATNTASPLAISYVVVSNSTAVTSSGGQILTAQFSYPATVGDDNSDNGNVNWNFPEPKHKVWDGSDGASWGTVENWTPSGVPQDSDLSITIPSGMPNQPALNTIYSYSCPITISNGATLNLNGNNLTLSGALTNMGAIMATASETLSCSKDVDFTGGTFTPASSTLKLNAAAAGSQTFKPSNCTFYRIEVPNAATVTFDGAGLTASQFSCRAPGATLNFNAGSTYTITDFDLRGSSSGATTNFVTLRSTSTPTKWNLNVTRSQAVRYVDAQDSDADGGLTIYAVNSVSTGPNNDNWIFGNTKAWAGGTSTDWGTAGNWSPSGVPGATDYVLIDGYYANAPTLSANTTNAGLSVGGYSSNAVLTLNATLTVDGNAVVKPTYGKINFTTDTAGGDLTVNSNLTVFGTIECQRAAIGGNGTGRVITVGGNLTVVSNGLITANAMGFNYTGGKGGPGLGYRAGAHGGEDYAGGQPCGATYGSITGPTSLGSAGWEGYGGGAIRLNVGGLAMIDAGATITADSANCNQNGAGGSVWLTTGTLAGGGTISAKGGDLATAEVGGGGRIAIVVTNGLYAGSLTVKAYGGAIDGIKDAAAGTIYLKGSNQAYGTLVVDNGNRSLTTASRTQIGSSVTDKTVGDVVLQNAGYLAVSTNETLTVNGSWSNAVATNAISGGTVEFAGAAPATIWGGNTWSNLTIATAGKIVSFEHSKTQTVYGIPAFSNVTLRSTLDNTQWHLRKPGDGEQVVGVVTVYDSDAGTAGTHRTFWGAIGSVVSDPQNVNWDSIKPKGTVILLR